MGTCLPSVEDLLCAFKLEGRGMTPLPLTLFHLLMMLLDPSWSCKKQAPGS